MPRLLIICLALLAAYCWWIEPSQLSVTEQNVCDSDPPFAPAIRVLLLTDWHLGRWSRPRTLQAKMNRLLKIHHRRPFDVVLLGGDYVDTDAQYLHRMEAPLETLRRMGVPIYAVAGNHDYTTYGGDIAPMAAFLEKSGVTILRNEAAAVMAAGQRLLVIGLDDLQQSPSYFQEDVYQMPDEYRQAAAKLDWYAHFDDLEPGTPRLVLAHNPDAVYLPGRKPLAVLSGHTHGGQMMLLDWVSRPLHRWLHPHLPPGSGVTWAGRKTVGGRTLIVSRGVEGSALPLRLMRPPEAVVVTFSG